VKNKRKRTKLSEILAGLHGHYEWVGTWPAIPVALPVNAPAPRREPVKTPPVFCAEAQPDGSIKRFTLQFEEPPDLPPQWVENIYERLFERILPPKQRTTEALTVEFYDAAIFGYAYAATSRERATRLKACKTLPPDSEERMMHEEVVTHCTPALEAIRHRIDEVLAGWKLPEAANYLEGFAYGIKCQHREEGWTPSADTETLQNCKALVRHQEAVQNLVSQKKIAKEIGQFVADRALLPDGKTSLARCMGNNEDAWADYLRNFQKTCERIGLPLPSPGRPLANPKIATPGI
jgi:hypothetical protein